MRIWHKNETGSEGIRMRQQDEEARDEEERGRMMRYS